MDISQKIDLKRAVSMCFRPGTPIDREQFLAGRQPLIDAVIDAIIQVGIHIVIFGERGVGKTSLAKVVSDIMQRAKKAKVLDSGTINCDTTDTFNSLWRKIFRELSFVMEAQEAGFGKSAIVADVPIEKVLPKRKLNPDDIRYFLSKIDKPIVVIIDELDRISDQATRSQLADTIKTLSDHAVNATLVLVGVADSVDELVAEHQSIQRSLVEVPVKRMPANELRQILKKGEENSGMVISEDCKLWITGLSLGLPHYTHLLGLHSSFSAINDGRTKVTPNDILEATMTAVRERHTIASAYSKAVSSPQKGNLYKKVLSACALAKTDEVGYFNAAALLEPLSEIMERECQISDFSRHLAEFCQPKRGPILKGIGKKWNQRYRFLDAMMQPYVIIHDYSMGLLVDRFLEKLRERYNELFNEEATPTATEGDS